MTQRLGRTSLLLTTRSRSRYTSCLVCREVSTHTRLWLILWFLSEDKRRVTRHQTCPGLRVWLCICIFFGVNLLYIAGCLVFSLCWMLFIYFLIYPYFWCAAVIGNLEPNSRTIAEVEIRRIRLRRASRGIYLVDEITRESRQGRIVCDFCSFFKCLTFCAFSCTLLIIRGVLCRMRFRSVFQSWNVFDTWHLCKFLEFFHRT